MGARIANASFGSPPPHHRTSPQFPPIKSHIPRPWAQMDRSTVDPVPACAPTSTGGRTTSICGLMMMRIGDPYAPATDERRPSFGRPPCPVRMKVPMDECRGIRRVDRVGTAGRWAPAGPMRLDWWLGRANQRRIILLDFDDVEQRSRLILWLIAVVRRFFWVWKGAGWDLTRPGQATRPKSPVVGRLCQTARAFSIPHPPFLCPPNRSSSCCSVQFKELQRESMHGPALCGVRCAARRERLKSRKKQQTESEK